MPLYYLIYQIICWLLFILFFPVFLVCGLITGKHLAGFLERLGQIAVKFPPGKTPRIWLHAASVGEVQAAKALIPELLKIFPEAALAVSTVTEQGQIQAKKELGHVAQCFLAPLDLTFFVERSIKTVQPDIYLCLETELWPAFLRQAHKKGVKLFLLNGRLSKKSLGRYRIISGFSKDILNRFSAIGAISRQDTERFLSLDILPEKVSTLGNVKYDTLQVAESPEVCARYRDRLQVAVDQPVLVAGSTHPGEYDILLMAAGELWRQYENLVLVLAPRHMDRLDKLATLLNEHDVLFDYWSTLEGKKRTTRVVVLDTMGELANLYSAATLVFCGGSLVDIGGHNPLEAAAWGKPILHGPFMQSVTDVRDMLKSAGAGFTVNSAQDVVQIVHHFLDNPSEYDHAALMAKDTVLKSQGAAARNVQLVAGVK